MWQVWAWSGSGKTQLGALTGVSLPGRSFALFGEKREAEGNVLLDRWQGTESNMTLQLVFRDALISATNIFRG